MDQQTDDARRSTSAEGMERRVVRTPAVGARVCLLIAALFVVAAGYFLLSPVRVVATDGGSWDCGTALSAPVDAFSTGLCGRLNDIYRARAMAFALAGVVTAVGGFLVFGTQQRVETRPRRRLEDDDL